MPIVRDVPGPPPMGGSFQKIVLRSLLLVSVLFARVCASIAMPSLLDPAVGSPVVAIPPAGQRSVSAVPAAPLRQQRLRCLIVSDHRLFTDLLTLSLASAPDLPVEIAEVTASAATAILACDKHRPGVVVLDLDLPDGAGVRVAEHVVATLPESRVIVVSRHAGDRNGSANHELILNGIVRQVEDFDALQAVLAEAVQPSGDRDPKRATPAARSHRLASVLTRRERQVLALIGQRLSSRAIAERLAISLHTINAHRKNIARKLGIPGANLAFVAFEYREQLRGLRL